MLFYSQGLILLMVRMLEPGMLRIHLGLLKKLFRCMFTGEPDDEEEMDIEPINMLFNSTLNIEFVYVILEGIVTFSKMSFGSNALDQSPMDRQFEDVMYSLDGQDMTVRVH